MAFITTTATLLAHPWPRLVTFVGLVCAGSATLAATFWLAGGELGRPEGRALMVLASVWPAVMALMVQGGLARQPILAPLGLRVRLNRWLLAAWLAPLAVTMCALAALALTGTDLALSNDAYVALHLDRVPAAQRAAFAAAVSERDSNVVTQFVVDAMIAGPTFLLVALGTELGFRGFAQAMLGTRPLARALATGVIAWLHIAPFVALGHLYPDHRGLGLGLALVHALVLAPTLAWLRERADSVIAPALFVATSMTLSGVPSRVARGSDLVVGAASLPVLGTLAVLASGLIMWDRIGARLPVFKTRPPSEAT